MSSFEGLYAIRAGKESDKSFILATFLRGLYYGESWYSEIPKDIFMLNYKKVGEYLFNNSSIIVACLPDDPDVILGYSIVSKDNTKLHFMYVKSAWRKQGIGRSILPHSITIVTHLTNLGKSLLPKLKNVIFDPFAIN